MKIFKRIALVVVILVILAGVVMLLFAPVSNLVGKQIAKGQTDSFERSLVNVYEGSSKDAQEKGEIDSEGYPVDKSGKRTSDFPYLYTADLQRLYEDSLAYNENLKLNQKNLLTDEYSYMNPALDLTEYGIYNGIYAYIWAPQIDMKLPIYLGANDTAMSYGAAHLTYTSLPVGGESTNVAIAGHTGYIGRVFFDNLRYLEIGDEIILRNYWESLTYEVIATRVVLPTQSEDIFIKEGKDMLTLITCVDDGQGGFNRYLVICEAK